MRIGIFCDAANPITNAHLTMIEAAKLQMKLDFIYIFPSNIAPAKGQETIASAADRISMARNAVFWHSEVVVRNNSDNPHIIDTINAMNKEFLQDELFLIVGAETLLRIDEFYDFKSILKKVTIVAFSHETDENLWRQVLYLTHSYGARITVLDAFVPDISDGMVRRLIKEGRSFRYLVPDSVRNYIVEHKLYGYRSENGD